MRKGNYVKELRSFIDFYYEFDFIYFYNKLF